MISLVNGTHSYFVFSGGEVQVTVKECHPQAHIKAILQSSQDVMQLLLLCDALKRMGKTIQRIDIPYLPYARQDRVCNTGEALALKVMCDLINSIGAKQVCVTDVHSDVALALIDNVHNYHPISFGLLEVIGDKLVICPDAGAEKRILKLGKPYVMATKVRDVANGQIKETKLHGKVEKRDCIIVDDICDGGRTFIELAKVLKENGARSIELYITHGIFSKGLEVFKDLIDNIYYYNYETGKIEQCK
jgi:ribose-phosphate pyrophosphokinase